LKHAFGHEKCLYSFGHWKTIGQIEFDLQEIGYKDVVKGMKKREVISF
jgi:hypothetical protein